MTGMTTDLGPSRCPVCDTTAKVYVRSADGAQLVCRGDVTANPPAIPADGLPRSLRHAVVDRMSAVVRRLGIRSTYLRRIP